MTHGQKNALASTWFAEMLILCTDFFEYELALSVSKIQQEPLQKQISQKAVEIFCENVVSQTRNTFSHALH
jgi:hypothetical protein